MEYRKRRKMNCIELFNREHSGVIVFPHSVSAVVIEEVTWEQVYGESVNLVHVHIFGC
jgi:hypothetical protein